MAVAVLVFNPFLPGVLLYLLNALAAIWMYDSGNLRYQHILCVYGIEIVRPSLFS